MSWLGSVPPSRPVLYKQEVSVGGQVVEGHILCRELRPTTPMGSSGS